jgi:hypothetical protein
MHSGFKLEIRLGLELLYLYARPMSGAVALRVIYRTTVTAPDTARSVGP